MQDDNKPIDGKTKADLLKIIQAEDPNYQPTNVVTWPNNPEPIEIIVEKLSTILPKKIEWLWRDIIAFGKITLFAGEPGVGKSQLLLYIASILSNGDKFHFQPFKCEPKNVLLISGEDNADDTIAPRLMALKANLDRIDYVKGIKKVDKAGNLYFDTICLVEHLVDLEQKIINNKYKLIIVDPISLYLGSIDDHKNKDIRMALGILNALAERHKLAIILNSHFTKPSGTGNKSAIYRIMGSIGFGAAARIVFGVLKDPENPTKRLFLPIKNNIGQDEIGFAYEIKPILLDDQIETSRIEWLYEKIDKTANEILNQSNPVKAPKREQLKELLVDRLKMGPQFLTELRKICCDNDFSIDLLYKAKAELNIIEDQEIGGYKRKFWRLPE